MSDPRMPLVFSLGLLCGGLISLLAVAVGIVLA